MERSALLRELETCGLLAEERLRRRVLDPDTDAFDAKALARVLVQEDWITPYQANQCLKALGRELVFGPYLLMERLGAGGQGQVYKARHRNLGRVVALKGLPSEQARDPAAMARFKREIEASGKLAHPNIVVAYDADEINGLLVLVMEYIDGADLDRLVREGGPLPVDLACHCIQQAALGLAHAHRFGLIHRDMKPSNIVLQALRDDESPVGREQRVVYGGVKLLDLGLAHFRSPTLRKEDAERITGLNQVMGTPDYIAPEQARSSQRADHRSDIYSLGATLYFCLAGHPPFPEGPPLEKLLKHQLEEPRPLEAIRNDLDAELLSLQKRMMAKDPGQRPQSASEVANTLARVRAERFRNRKPLTESRVATGPGSELDFAGTDTPTRLLHLQGGRKSHRDWLLWILATLATVNLGLIIILIVRALLR